VKIRTVLFPLVFGAAVGGIVGTVGLAGAQETPSTTAPGSPASPSSPPSQAPGGRPCHHNGDTPSPGHNGDTPSPGHNGDNTQNQRLSNHRTVIETIRV
jgi:hypothetical protein